MIDTIMNFVNGLNAYVVFSILIVINLAISITIAKIKKEFDGDEVPKYLGPLVQYLFLVFLINVAIGSAKGVIDDAAMVGVKTLAYGTIIWYYVKQTYKKGIELYNLIFKTNLDDTFNGIIPEKSEDTSTKSEDK